MYYEVELIPMGYVALDNSSTADETEWINPDKPDMLNILVTKHMDDDSGDIEMIHDIDFPPSMAGMANTLLTLFSALAHYANNHQVDFGTVKNPYVTTP